MAGPLTLSAPELAQMLLTLVREQGFEQIADPMRDGRPLADFPSIDLAVAVLPPDGAPVWANVLFSRDYPDGRIADIGADAGPVRNVRYLADQTNAALDSVAWLPGSDWSTMAWQPLYGNGPLSFVQPYPASLLKVMVLVGVARLVDVGRYDWPQPWSYGGVSKTIDAWADSMIVASNNDATSALVALLHAGGLIARDGATEHNQLHQLFAAWGLPTLRLADTRPDGGWRSADGAGVGHIHMTAWDTVRLLWLLLEEGAQAPWLAAGAAPLLSSASRQRCWRYLSEQGLHEVLSTTALAGAAGWRAGIPARLPERFIGPDGSVLVEDIDFPADVRAANAAATVQFAHKTGNTDNYTSDAGLVQSLRPGGRRYLIAMLSNLGRRYRACEYSVTDYRVAALGAAIDRRLAELLEPPCAP